MSYKLFCRKQWGAKDTGLKTLKTLYKDISCMKWVNGCTYFDVIICYGSFVYV